MILCIYLFLSWFNLGSHCQKSSVHLYFGGVLFQMCLSTDDAF